MTGWSASPGPERASGTQLVPDLAVAVPRPSDEGKSYRFQLRDGIRYEDGSPVRASDARHALERTLRLGLPDAASYYASIVGAARCHKGRPCDLSRGIVADDAAGTVTFSLVAPDADFLHKLALPFASLVPASAGPGEATGRHPIPGTGPYMIANSPRPAERLVLVRNPCFREWSHAAQPDGYPDRLVFLGAKSASAAVDAVLRGAADLVRPPPERAHELETRYPAFLRSHPSSLVLGVFLNPNEPPFDDLRVRRAVAFALDRGRMIRSLGGHRNQVTCQLMAPNFPGYVPYCPYTAGRQDGTWHKPDLATARRLVRASGTAGMSVTFSIPETFPRAGGVVIVSTLRQLGYHAHLLVLPNDAYYTLLYTEAPTLLQAGHKFGYSLDFLAGSAGLDPAYRCVRADAYYGYAGDATVCGHMRRAVKLASLGLEREANAMWSRVDHELVDRAPFVAYATLNTVEIVSSRVGNYRFNPLLGLMIGQAWVR